MRESDERLVDALCAECWEVFYPNFREPMTPASKALVYQVVKKRARRVLQTIRKQENDN
ncbi:hypothetical protein [Vibrio sp. Isolate30]|uniref:hypothetical protein n=1 Tax=Vibrio sp. Isolate30 TaxID=2908536 RepID=UPI001EFC8859|nr:hypothetical protein [Vibrio sp. Isolate30]MCG9632262.1 hypothetical protein [Vibrio sp. Isolate30]